MNQFPENPANGTIFELKPGIFFIYDAALKSWNRIEGLVTPPLATAVNDGLMSKEDLRKLNRLIVPPPQSTLTTEDCINTFDAGLIGFRGGDNFVVVEGEEALQNVAAGCVTEPVNFQMHQHTYFFDFTINETSLFNYMKEEGKFVVRSKRGPEGPPGKRGEDGEDMLPFGPDGDTGEDGANAPVTFTLTEEPVDFTVKKKYKRAIVEMEVDLIDDDEYALIIRRANVGNPDACPSLLRLNSDTNSTWILAVRDLSSDSSFINFNFSTNDDLPDDCLLCNTELFYLDIQPMIAAIRAEHDLQTIRLKEGFENIVVFWLNIMSGLFDEQKAALCCASEYCQSQTRNNDTRQFIEGQRIQAAISGSTIAIDGDPASKSVTIMDPACEPDGFGTDTENSIPNNADPIGGAACVAGLIVISEPERTVLQFPECPPGFVPRDEARARYKGAGSGVLIQSTDPRYRQYLHEVRGDDTSALARPIESEPTNISLYQEISGEGFIHYDIWYVTGLDKKPDQGTLGNMALPQTKKLESGTHLLQFSDSLLPGIYTLYVNNKSKSATSFKLYIATQNAQFIRGTGEGWKDDYIQQSDEDGTFGSNTVIECEEGPAYNEGWWLQIRVLPERLLPTPYSRKCGSLGPRPTRLDNRLCKEVPRGMRNPLMRENELDISYRGAMRDWITTKCGDYLVPDAVQIKIAGNDTMSEVGDVVLCRTNLGNYTGGFNFGKYSAQILLEQEDAQPARPAESLLYHKETKDSYQDVKGSNKYKCTLLVWEGEDCGGDVFEFASVSVPAQCEDWSMRGNWNLNSFGAIGFQATSLENDNSAVDLASASSTELLLYVSSRKNIKHRHRRTTASLSRGQYTVDIVNCCLQSGTQYTGHIEIEYNDGGERKVVRFPSQGTYTDSDQARNAYVGLTVEIDHSGGEVSAALVSPITQLASGEIVVRFASSIGYEPDLITLDNRAGRQAGCRIHTGHIRWLEQKWGKRECDGVVLVIGGQEYIIVHPNKPMHTQCSARYPQEGLSYAWPTFDGKSFVGIPDTGSVNFKEDAQLQSSVDDAIQHATYSERYNNARKITTVLFPVV